MRIFAGILVLSTVFGLGLAAEKPTILAVFAHPDDESAVGALLASYAAKGHDVYLAVATLGQVGDANTDIPRGEALGAAREAEARCACQALGIRPPILLGFMDGLLADREVLPKLVNRVREVFDQVKPATVVTWGPDGLSGHPDHRIISSVVTDVFQQQGKLSHRPSRLYYVAFPEDRVRDLPPGASAMVGQAGLVSSQWITTEVEVAAYSDQALKAIQCHKTQWSPQMMEMIHQLSMGVLGGKSYLRRALGDPTGSGTPESGIVK